MPALGAGDVSFYNEAGGSGSLTVQRKGKVDAGFEVADITAYLGDNPLVITANTTIAVATGDVPTGVAYLLSENGNIYISDGDTDEGDEDAVTGIHVKPGKTLTLGLNVTRYNSRYDSYLPAAFIYLGDDLHNEGTLTTDDSTYGPGTLDVYAEVFIGSKGSRIDVGGRAAGEFGGSIDIYGNSAVVNQGRLITSGRDSSTGNGGDAGYIDLVSDGLVQNTGAVEAKGGNSTFATGDGGDAEGLYLFTYGYDHGAGVYNSGNVSANGGNAPRDAGVGGYLDLEAMDVAANFNSGNLIANGGSSLTRSGASGGVFDTSASGGELRNSGSVTARGGNSAADGYSAGDGGWINAQVRDNFSYNLDRVIGVRDISYSGAVDLRGGDALASSAAYGGHGGDFDVEAYVAYDSDGSDMLIVGYDQIVANGGAGRNGGSGGDVYIETETSETYNDNYGEYEYDQAASILADIGISLTGGDALANGDGDNGYGGYGGSFYLQASDSNANFSLYYGDAVIATFTGDVDLSGGKNRAGNGSSGSGGSLNVFGANGLLFAADVRAVGGADISKIAGYGGDGGQFLFRSIDGEVDVSGKFNLAGGTGSLVGGDGGVVSAYSYEGATISYAGKMDVSGGNAKTSLVGSVGGDGGYSCGFPDIEDLVDYTFGTGDSDGSIGGVSDFCA